MMAGKEDLGLSLSLSVPQIKHSMQLNLMPSPVPSTASSSLSGFHPQKPSWNVTFASPGMPFSFVKQSKFLDEFKIRMAKGLRSILVSSLSFSQ